VRDDDVRHDADPGGAPRDGDDAWEDEPWDDGATVVQPHR
jgi:hypothetical protein